MNIVPLTMWREARGEGEAGMLAVAHVIMNRAKAGKQWPADPEQVCLQPYQFSCWNTDDSQRKLYPAPNDELYAVAITMWDKLRAAAVLMWPQSPGGDPTGGATFYRNVAVAGAFPPGYRETVIIGNHTFAKL